MSATIDRSTWKRVRLGDVIQVCHGKCQHSIESNTGKYPILATSGEIGRTDSYLYDKPSVLIGRKGTIDKPQYIDSPFWTIDTLFYTKIAEGYNPKFLYYLCLTIDWASMNEASGVPSLSANRIESLEVTIPDIDEQDKITNALSSIDKHVSTLDALIAKYEAIKKATVNLLLEPKADWRTSTMGESFDLSRGVVISKNEIERRPGIYPVYSSQSVNDGVLGLIDSYRYDGEYITWTTDGANAGTVFYRHGKFNCTNVCGIAKARIPKMSPAFVALMIAQYAKSYVSYVGNPKLMSNIFAQILFSYPSASEQRKIAEKITAIDKVLADYKAQLEKARQLKAGMMSYFFG